MKFGIYDSNGFLIRTGECKEEHIEYQPNEGEFVYKGDIALTDRVNTKTGEKISVVVPDKPEGFYSYSPKNNKWVPNLDLAWESVKHIRTQKLKATDWLVVSANEKGVPIDPEVMAYRQALRDITLQKDPMSIVWPVKPEKVK